MLGIWDNIAGQSEGSGLIQKLSTALTEVLNSLSTGNSV